MEKNQPISYKRIIAVTYPVILSMFSMNIMVFVDRAFVAKYDLTQFAAIVPAGNMATAFAGFFVGIIGFSSTLVSQYYGARKYNQCTSSMWQGVYLSIFFSAVLLAIAPFATNIFQLMGHSGKLLLYEKQYFNLIILSSCAFLFLTAFSALFRGIGDTRTTMFVGFLINAVNILLDWVLIFGKFGLPEMGGIYGSGIATLISNITGVITYILLLNKKIFKNTYLVFENFGFAKNLTNKLLRFGLPSGIQVFVGTGYFSLLLLIIGKTGEFNLTSANIAFTIEGVSIFPVWGLGFALGIIAAQERGAGRIGNVIKVVQKGVLIGLCYNLFIIALYNCFPGFLVMIFHSGGDLKEFLRLKEYTIPLVRLTSIWIVMDTIQIIIGNVLRSVGDTLFMMIICLVMPFLFYLVLPYLIVVTANLPLFWVWIGLILYTGAMLTLVTARLIGGKWKKINVI